MSEAVLVHNHNFYKNLFNNFFTVLEDLYICLAIFAIKNWDKNYAWRHNNDYMHSTYHNIFVR